MLYASISTPMPAGMVNATLRSVPARVVGENKTTFPGELTRQVPCGVTEAPNVSPVVILQAID